MEVLPLAPTTPAARPRPGRAIGFTDLAFAHLPQPPRSIPGLIPGQTPAGTAAAETAGKTGGAAGTTGSAAADAGGFGFDDFLDLINPLQHIPIVSTIYRAITDDQIAPIPRILGGALFGGLPGFIASTVNAVVADVTGKDIGGQIQVALFGDSKAPDAAPDAPPVMVAEADTGKAIAANTATGAKPLGGGPLGGEGPLKEGPPGGSPAVESPAGAETVPEIAGTAAVGPGLGAPADNGAAPPAQPSVAPRPDQLPWYLAARSPGYRAAARIAPGPAAAPQRPAEKGVSIATRTPAASPAVSPVVSAATSPVTPLATSPATPLAASLLPYTAGQARPAAEPGAILAASPSAAPPSAAPTDRGTAAYPGLPRLTSAQIDLLLSSVGRDAKAVSSLGRRLAAAGPANARPPRPVPPSPVPTRPAPAGPTPAGIVATPKSFFRAGVTTGAAIPEATAGPATIRQSAPPRLTPGAPVMPAVPVAQRILSGLEKYRQAGRVFPLTRRLDTVR